LGRSRVRRPPWRTIKGSAGRDGGIRFDPARSTRSRLGDQPSITGDRQRGREVPDLRPLRPERSTLLPRAPVAAVAASGFRAHPAPGRSIRGPARRPRQGGGTRPAKRGRRPSVPIRESRTVASQATAKFVGHAEGENRSCPGRRTEHRRPTARADRLVARPVGSPSPGSARSGQGKPLPGPVMIVGARPGRPGRGRDSRGAPTRRFPEPRRRSCAFGCGRGRRAGAFSKGPRFRGQLRELGRHLNQNEFAGRGAATGGWATRAGRRRHEAALARPE